MSLWWKAEPVVAGRPAGQVPDAFATYGPFFLARLDRLSALRASNRLTPLETRLLDRALYSTYWDCVRLGAREQARDLIRDVSQA